LPRKNTLVRSLLFAPPLVLCACTDGTTTTEIPVYEGGGFVYVDSAFDTSDAPEGGTADAPTDTKPDTPVDAEPDTKADAPLDAPADVLDDRG
jgi:hypothetical protein